MKKIGLYPGLTDLDVSVICSKANKAVTRTVLYRLRVLENGDLLLQMLAKSDRM